MFFDDDLKRHHLFQLWLDESRAPSGWQKWLNLFRGPSQRLAPEPIETQPSFDVESAIRVLSDEVRFDVAFLDHDLDGRTFVEEREGTGTEVAEFIASLPATQRPRRIILHSHNPAGAIRMRDILVAGGSEVEMVPFGTPEFRRLLREL